MNVPPGGQGGYPGGGHPPPWHTRPSSSTRPGTGFNKKRGGAGCGVVAVGLFALVCIAAGAIALVLFLKGRRSGPVDDPPVATRIAATAKPQSSRPPTSAAPTASGPRPVRPPGKRD